MNFQEDLNYLRLVLIIQIVFQQMDLDEKILENIILGYHKHSERHFYNLFVFCFYHALSDQL